MRKARSSAVVALLVLGMSVSPALAATSPKPGSPYNIIMGDYHASVSGFVSHSTTYMPLWYIMQGLKAMGYTVTWSGTEHRLVIQVPDGIPVHLSNLSPGKGSSEIYVNGVLVQRLTTIVSKEYPSAVPTTYVPIWYIQRVLKLVNLSSTWSKAFLTVTPVNGYPVVLGANKTFGSTGKATNVTGNLLVLGTNVQVQNANVSGDVYLNPGANGTVELNNVKLSGSIIVESGAPSSIHLNNVIAPVLSVVSTTPVHIVSEGTTAIQQTEVAAGDKQPVSLEQDAGTLGSIIDDAAQGITLSGTQPYSSVTVSSSGSLTISGQSQVSSLTINASNATVSIEQGASVSGITVNNGQGITIQNNGYIGTLTNNSSSGSVSVGGAGNVTKTAGKPVSTTGSGSGSTGSGSTGSGSTGSGSTGSGSTSFNATTDTSTQNNVGALGLVGTSASSNDSSVATAAISSDGSTVDVTSVAPGTATITLSDASGDQATIAVTVNADGSITIGTITPYLTQLGQVAKIVAVPVESTQVTADELTSAEGVPVTFEAEDANGKPVPYALLDLGVVSNQQYPTYSSLYEFQYTFRPTDQVITDADGKVTDIVNVASYNGQNIEPGDSFTVQAWSDSDPGVFAQSQSFNVVDSSGSSPTGVNGSLAGLYVWKLNPGLNEVDLLNSNYENIYSTVAHTIYVSFGSTLPSGTELPSEYVPAALTVNGVAIGSSPTPVQVTGAMFYVDYRPAVGTFTNGEQFTDTLTVSDPADNISPQSVSTDPYTPQPESASQYPGPAVDAAASVVQVFTENEYQAPISTNTIDLGDSYDGYVTPYSNGEPMTDPNLPVLVTDGTHVAWATWDSAVNAYVARMSAPYASGNFTVSALVGGTLLQQSVPMQAFGLPDPGQSVVTVSGGTVSNGTLTVFGGGKMTLTVQPRDAQGNILKVPYYNVLLQLNGANYPSDEYAQYDPATGTYTFNIGTDQYLPMERTA